MGRRRQRAASDQRRECAPENTQPALTSPSTEVAAVAPPADSGWITTAVQRMVSFFGGGHARRSSEVVTDRRQGRGKVGGKGARTGRTGNQAWMFQSVRRKKNTTASSTSSATGTATPMPTSGGQNTSSPQPRRQAVMVGGELVSGFLVDLHAEYCEKSSLSGQIVCHYCYFQNYVTKNLSAREIVLHWHTNHPKADRIQCNQEDCRVIVSSPRELELHVHFSHVQPTGWWLE
uniref:Uncharacterized protein n=1 Tax=Oryza punctata TaxID=4537 RepID=A0A0E0MGM2_ORYPU